MVYVDSEGESVSLGPEIKTGGEGTVYEVVSRHTQAAKIYSRKHQPDARKQAKLTFMVAAGSEKLRGHVAWPARTLSPAMGGPVVGFLMQRVQGWPIADSYHPQTRKRSRPRDTWEFLLRVARNVAAAFDTVHEHGHVLGDVNHGNVLVKPDSTVVLIDSDSYQINANGTLHLCGVGVREYVPPELQGLASLERVTRTANHDNFGLAVLIFQLLLNGRHPCDGTPLIAGAGDAVEQDIKAFRYAFARDAQARGMKPPPLSVPITLLPDRMREMFFQAFTEVGVQGGRPTAGQWCEELSKLLKGLHECRSVPSMHVYPKGLGTGCPWCKLEGEGVEVFPAPGRVAWRPRVQPGASRPALASQAPPLQPRTVPPRAQVPPLRAQPPPWTQTPPPRRARPWRSITVAVVLALLSALIVRLIISGSSSTHPSPNLTQAYQRRAVPTARHVRRPPAAHPALARPAQEAGVSAESPGPLQASASAQSSSALPEEDSATGEGHDGESADGGHDAPQSPLPPDLVDVREAPAAAAQEDDNCRLADGSWIYVDSEIECRSRHGRPMHRL
jgi:DNA-binding helix-hairpin-helix protein with protein kinase domain